MSINVFMGDCPFHQNDRTQKAYVHYETLFPSVEKGIQENSRYLIFTYSGNSVDIPNKLQKQDPIDVYFEDEVSSE